MLLALFNNEYDHNLDPQFEKKTSRERPKSAPYLRLKIEKGDLSGFVKLQLVAKNEKNEGGPLGDMKKFPKNFFKMRFLNSVTVPKNVKGGTLCDFLTSIVLQNIETNEGGPLVQSKKFQKVL